MKRVPMIAVWLLLIALPLQGVASFLPSAHCTDEFSGHGTYTLQNQSGDHHGMAAHDHEFPAAADHQHHDDEPADQAGGHSCCHPVFSGSAQSRTIGTPDAPSALSTGVSLLTTLYIPDLPQRPPRA